MMTHLCGVFKGRWDTPWEIWSVPTRPPRCRGKDETSRPGKWFIPRFPLPAPRLTDSPLIKNTHHGQLLRECKAGIPGTESGTKQVINFSKATDVNILKDAINQNLFYTLSLTFQPRPNTRAVHNSFPMTLTSKWCFQFIIYWGFFFPEIDISKFWSKKIQSTKLIFKV